jgi:hypothetical protein
VNERSSEAISGNFVPIRVRRSEAIRRKSAYGNAAFWVGAAAHWGVGGGAFRKMQRNARRRSVRLLKLFARTNKNSSYESVR